MQSFAWRNGQYQQVGPPSQSQQGASPLTSPTMWIQQAGTANNSSSTDLRPPQSAQSTFRDGAYSGRQTSDWQNSGVPHQAVSSQLPAGGATNNYYVAVIPGNLQDSFTNAQSGNPLVTNGLQVAAQQGFHSNTGFVSSMSQIPQNMMKSNTTYPQQDMSALWNQQALQHEQMVCTNRQTAHNQNHRQNLAQHGFSSSIPPPPYNQSVSHSVGNYRITANPSSIEQVSSVSQKTQQYQTHVNSSHINMNYESQRFLSKTNEIPLNPAAATQDQMRTRQIIARIADELRMSCTQKSNPKMQPVTQTVANTNSYNSNSGLSLSNSVMSRMQHSVNAPQQSSVPNVYVTATSGGCGEVRLTNGGKAANAFFAESNMVSKGNLVGSLHNTSQLLNLPERLTGKRKQGESSAPNEILEILGKLSSVTANDGSIHSSPGRTCTRAVAVVQPLSQESCQQTFSNMINQSAEHNASAESLSNPKKLCTSPAVAKNKKELYMREGTYPYPGNPNHISPSDSVGHQDSQKQLCADDTGSEPAAGMQEDQCVAITAQQSVASEVTVNHEDNFAVLLSSVPAKPWTIDALSKLILDHEKTQMELSKNTVLNTGTQLLDLYWDGSIRNLACRLRTGWYKSLLSNTTGFLSKHVTADSVILSQVKQGYKKTLIGYHVLKDDEVYSGPPYKSSWLNVSEQLDDIDKEFGFPWSLKHHFYLPESHSQPDQVETVKSIPAEIASEVPDKVSSQTELEPVDSGEEKRASTPGAASTQADSPDETKCDDSSDPFYSIEIQVLPPEQAKLIFEQAQSMMPQSMDTDSQPESVMNSSVEGEPLEAIDVTLNGSEPKNTSSCPIEQVCCLSKWLEKIMGSNPLLSGCNCINEQSLKDCAEKTHDEGEMEVQKEGDICANWSDSKFDMEGESQAEGQENIKSQMITYSRSEPCNKLSQALAFAENIIVLSENKDGDLSSSDTVIQLDPGVDHIQESTQSCTSASSDKDIDNPPGSESEISSRVSDLEEDCGQAQLTSTDVGVSTLETEEEQTQISVTAAMQTTFSGTLENAERKLKRQRSHDRPFPCLKKSNKCEPPGDLDSEPSEPSTFKEVSIDVTDSEPLASKHRAVQLVLFGSAPQDKSVLIGGRKRYNSSPGAVPDGPPRPPEFISVKLSPLKRKFSDTVPTGGEQSVKWRIHEKWRRSLPPTKMRRQNKLKTWKCTYASSSGFGIKKAKAIGPTTTERPPVSSETRILNPNHGTNRCLSLKKRRRSLPARLKHGEETMRKYVVTLKQPADREGRNTENESQAGRPLQENNVLRFSVLPNTFNFKDGSIDRKETDDSVPSKPALDEDKDKNPNKTVGRPMGTWYPNPEKKYCPLLSPSVPNTSSLFQEFQKKYKKKTQPSTDELTFSANSEITDCPNSGK
ncbi:uncharacterized protein [Pagrus major]|uniref:uncharacterized protein isoform X1 n=1 Tax=Pagrus major TaxID=143350 RepID=UPI003CC8BEA4